MMIEDCVDRNTKDKLNKLRLVDLIKKGNKSREKKMSHKDIEDLMGIHRPIYERRSGAMRRK